MPPEVDYVHHLNSKSFRSFIESSDAVLLAVVLLPYSGRCIKYVPKHRKIAENVRNSSVKVAQINVMDSGDVLAPFDISTFPRIMLFKGLADFRTYRGAFSELHVMSYINRFLGFPTLSVISASLLPQFKENNDVVVVGYFPSDSQELKDHLKLLAKEMHPEYLFGITTDASLAAREGIDNPSVIVYNAFDGGRSTITLSTDISSMSAAIRKAARPLIADLTPETHDGFLEIGMPFGYVFAVSIEERDRLHQELDGLARQFREDLLFGIADPNAENLTEDLHVEKSHYPAFAIREPKMNLRYPMSNNSELLFKSSVEEFVRCYLAGKLKPTVKSEPLPEVPTDGLVKIVGLNYQQIVMDATRDVLVVYCIEACGPCIELQPTLAALAEVYACSLTVKDKVTIGQIDYDANDNPERSIRGFPTIKLFPAASKQTPIMFLGDRTVTDLVEFISVYGTHKAYVHDQVAKQNVP